MKHQKMHVAKWANEDKQQQKLHEDLVLKQAEKVHVEPSFKTSGRCTWNLVKETARGD